MKSFKCSDIDPTQIRISKVCPPFKAGTKEITKLELVYGNEPLYILGPKLYCPFGLSQFPKPEDVTKYTKVKYTLQMNFKGYKEGFKNMETTESLYQFFNELDFLMLNMLKAKSGDFLNQATNDDSIIDKMYQRLIQIPDNDEYDPFFRLKLPTEYRDNKKFKTTFFDEKQNDLKLDTETLGKHLENRRWVRPIIKLDCLWYIEGKVYPNIEGHMLKIYSEIEKKKEKKVEKSESKPDKKKKKAGNKKIEFI